MESGGRMRASWQSARSWVSPCCLFWLEEQFARGEDKKSITEARGRLHGRRVLCYVFNHIWALKKPSKEHVGRGANLGNGLRRARLGAVALLLTLAGCVTVENTLSQSDVADMKLTGVAVNVDPGAMVIWEDGLRAYAAAKGVPDDQIMGFARTPEAKAYVQNALAARVKAGVERVMAGTLIGRRPVRLDVTVRSFEIAGPLMSILIGGGRGMTADATLVDARTGAVIISSPKESVALPAGSGLLGTAIQAAIDSSSDQSVTDKVIATFGQDYRRWLLRETS